MMYEKFIPKPVDDEAWDCPVGIRVCAPMMGSKADEVIGRWGRRRDGYAPTNLYLTVRESGGSQFVGVRRVWITIHIEGKFLPCVVGEVWINEAIPPGSIVCLQESFMRWGEVCEEPENPGWIVDWRSGDWKTLWESLELVIRTEPDYLIVIESDGNAYIPKKG